MAAHGRNALSISVVAVSLATSTALAAGLTERLQTERMTVVQVDRSGSRFLCAEHRRWVRVPKADAATLAIGDIVSVERRGGEVSRVRVVRTAADELASPER